MYVRICFARSKDCLQQRIRIKNRHDPQINPLADHEIVTIGFGDLVRRCREFALRKNCSEKKNTYYIDERYNVHLAI